MAFQRSIRINGKAVRSPKFKRASDAKNWYDEKQREKLHVKEGVPLPLDQETTNKFYFDTVWFPRRRKNYSKATWGADLQRFKDYVEPVIGNLRVSKTNALQVKACLIQVTEKHNKSIATRNRVRALLSKFFGDAMNEPKPLRIDNPAFNISFSDPRQGKKKPDHIARKSDVVKFLKEAKRKGLEEYAIASTFLMAGLRKSELIALKWSAFDEHDFVIRVTSRFVQAEGKIMEGTKAGREESREVHIPDALVTILNGYRAKSLYQADDDFIFTADDGRHMGPRIVWEMITGISQAAGLEASPHALRHTMGRLFAANGGSMKSLQTILGHASGSTTEIYSELAAEQTKKDRNLVSFDIDDEDDDA